MSNDPCRLVRLTVKDFMRLDAFVLTLGDGPVTQICGPNASGKTSAIRALEALLFGASALPAKPIREGAESAEILGELSNGLTVTRRITAKGTRLEVTSKDGASYKSPQSILDGLVSAISFDPLAWLGLEDKDKAAQLRQIVGLDFAPLDAARKTTYDARTAVGRDMARLSGQLSGMPEIEAPDAEVSAVDLLAEQQRRSEEKAANEARRASLHSRRAEYARAEQMVADAAQALARAKADMDAAIAARDLVGAAGKILAAEVAALVDPDLTEIPDQLRQVEATNAAVRAKRERTRVVAEMAKSEADRDRLTAEIDRIDAERAQMLAAAAFPVPGLSFDPGGGITYEGRPIDQASQAQALRVSMGIAIARNPKLKVVACKDASVLDRTSRELVRQMAAEAGAQVILEIVRDTGTGITIEDGEPTAEEVA